MSWWWALAIFISAVIGFCLGVYISIQIYDVLEKEWDYE